MTPPIIDAIRGGSTPDVDALVHALARHLPALADYARTPQDPEWHAEGDVHVHTGMVLDVLYESLAREPAPPEERVALVLGALLHDYAKPATTTEMEIRGVMRVAAPRHEPLGRDALGPLLAALGLPYSETRAVMDIVGYHHEPKLLVMKNREKGAYLRLARAVSPGLLHRVVHADMAGRICEDRAAQLEIVELFRMFAIEHEAEGWATRARASFVDVGPTELARELAFGETVRALEAGRVGSVDEARHLRFGRTAPIPELVVTIGPSGSGKSTWVERHLSPRGFTVVSLDAMREALSGRRDDQRLNGQVRQAARERVKAALRDGRSVVWDATSLRADFRAQTAELGFAYGALVTFVLFPRGRDALRARNRERAHAVPDAVLDKQLAGWEWPESHECHRMLVIGERGEVVGFEGGVGDAPPYGVT